jgi:hypothetical protein
MGAVCVLGFAIRTQPIGYIYSFLPRSKHFSDCVRRVLQAGVNDGACVTARLLRTRSCSDLMVKPARQRNDPDLQV